MKCLAPSCVEHILCIWHTFKLPQPYYTNDQLAAAPWTVFYLIWNMSLWKKISMCANFQPQTAVSLAIKTWVRLQADAQSVASRCCNKMNIFKLIVFISVNGGGLLEVFLALSDWVPGNAPTTLAVRFVKVWWRDTIGCRGCHSQWTTPDSLRWSMWAGLGP